jgi:hypothetical protein
MKRLHLTPAFLTLAAVLPTVALAHPGHDGHELTWELSRSGHSHLNWIIGAALVVTVLVAAYRYAKAQKS